MVMKSRLLILRHQTKWFAVISTIAMYLFKAFKHMALKVVAVQRRRFYEYTERRQLVT